MGLLKSLDRLLQEGGGVHFVSGRLSYADLAVFNTFQYFEAVRPGCIEDLGFPMLSAFHREVECRPRVRDYLQSDRHYPLTELEALTPGYQSNGQPMGLKYTEELKRAQW